MNRENVIKFLEEVRAKRLCAYIGTRCDCKYGADHIGAHGESGNGCPEMRCVEAMFELMTDKEFERLKKRASKGSKFFFEI